MRVRRIDHGPRLLLWLNAIHCRCIAGLKSRMPTSPCALGCRPASRRH